LGDIIYWSGEQEKKASVFTLPFKKLFDLASDHQFRCVLGNHDFMTNKGQWYLKDSDFGFVGGNDFYVITDMAHVDFFMLNSNPDALWDKQRPWLENALKQSQKPWKVACGHHPLFSSGRYGDSPFLQGKCQDLFQKYKVQFYFNGHDHAYERTKMIKGTIYITAGMSGASLYEENKPNQNTTVRIINQFGLLESVWEKDWCWFTFRSPYDSSRDVDTVKMNLSDFA
jgi:acid phosphatase